MIRVGVIGFGLAGRVFHAPLISSVDGLQLAAVVERSTNFAAERYPGIAVYRTVEEMLADTSLDLIVVASPSGTHFDVARQVIAAGKNLVVDKPVATSSAEIAQLIALAKERGVMLVPFHNRRWDADSLTVQKLVHEGAVGRLVSVESRMDRWNPGATRRQWKNDPAQGGGILLDLGTHLIYLALVLFGKPLGVSAEVDRERDGDGADDAFTIRLRYDRLRVTLGSNMLSAVQPPRFVLRGTQGGFRKSGLDPQEAALSKITRIDSPEWGQEPREQWGTLSVQKDGVLVNEIVETIPGNYRRFYEGLRDALLRHSEPPVPAVEAWRAARIAEWAQQSSAERREIACDWSGEPA
ncbi:Gfo/Idh/MocA family oxidoreductase [Occallatibacter riparius]|uniref:Gfo/Idh/MocA family oxidoreductase n=1 Tax=Occallatibacter riparius TaxID=1002689 RepID=A0A9J7BMA6_9BACT|nr:Gfo/Idh/MocA family oxidoreductase [Occallatibacter riparius]UWZ82333.1 Gfo/Idh/MocA family oxidoreductase [Occallatibacter riparius]